MRAILMMAGMEFRLLLRDGQTLFWSVAFPVLMVLLFGELYRPSQPGSSHAYLNHFLPGLLAISAASVALFSVGVTVAGCREHGVYRRLRVTPVSSVHLVISQAVPSLCLVLLNIAIVLVLAGYQYGCSPDGSRLVLIAVVAGVNLSFSVLAFAMAAIAPTARAANSAAVAVLMPMMLLSGVLFPRDQLSGALCLIGDRLPLTHAVDLLRGVWTGTAGPFTGDAAWLVAWAGAGLLTARLLFRWD